MATDNEFLRRLTLAMELIATNGVVSVDDIAPTRGVANAYFGNSVTAFSSHQVKAGGGVLYGFTYTNYSVARWLQFYDQVAGPPAGVPLRSFAVVANQNAVIGNNFLCRGPTGPTDGVVFSNGLLVALSSTGLIYTATSQDFSLQVFYD